MNYISLSILTSFLTLCMPCTAQREQLEFHDLKGNVKSVVQTIYFNKKYSQAEKFQGTVDSLLFNKNGKTVNIKFNRDTTTFPVQSERQYFYNEMGQLDSCLHFWKGQLSGKEIYSFDNKGVLKMKTYYNSPNDSMLYKLFIFHNGQNLIENYTSYDYNKEDSVLYDFYKLSYDTLGRVSKIHFYSIQDGEYINSILVRNSEGFVSKKETSVITKIYKGQRKKTTFTYLYEYDDRGNWIKQTAKKGCRFWQVTFREIEYY